MRFAFVLVLAGCGVQIDGTTKATDGSTDTPPPTDAATDPPDAPRPCTGGDMNMTVGGQCLLLFTGTPRTWADASTQCANMGARLAVLDTAAKYTAAKAFAGMRDVWIGLSDTVTEGSYRWVDATPFSYSAWHMNEPSNGAGTYEEDCAVIAGATARDWDDRPCSDAVPNAPAGCCSYAYMCQF